MGLVRVGERMKRARRRMAAAEMVARSERTRRVPSMFAVLAVREERGNVRRQRGEEGYWVGAGSYLDFLEAKTAVYRALQLSEAEKACRLLVYCISQRACIHHFGISFHCMMMQEGAPLRPRTAGPVDNNNNNKWALGRNPIA